MSDVIFEDEGEARRQFYSHEKEENKRSRMVGWLIKLGVARTKKAATVLLVVFSALMFILSIYLFIAQGQQKAGGNEVIYIEDIPEDIRKTIPPIFRNAFPSKHE